MSTKSPNKEKNQPDFSIIIAHRPGEDIESLISGIRASLAGNPELEAEILAVSGNQPSVQRNEAAEAARGRILYFLDNDACPAADNWRLLADIFRDNQDVAVVGGPSLAPDKSSRKADLFQYVLGSFWATAFIHARYARVGKARRTSDRELILCNLAFRREVFCQMGGFNEKLYPNEENELMDRLRAEGHSLMYHPDVVVYRPPRQSWGAFIRQLFGYGRGRAEQMRQHFSVTNLVLFVFLFFPIYSISLPLLAVFAPLLAVPVLVYLFLSIIFALPAARRLPFFWPAAVPGFFLSHFCYGVGMWRGLLGPLRSHSVVPEVSITSIPLRKADKD